MVSHLSLISSDCYSLNYYELPRKLDLKHELFKGIEEFNFARVKDALSQGIDIHEFLAPSPLFIACRGNEGYPFWEQNTQMVSKNQAPIIKLLVEHGATMSDGERDEVFFIACNKGNLEVAKLILQTGEVSKNIKTRALIAVSSKDSLVKDHSLMVKLRDNLQMVEFLLMAEFLLDQGADPNQRIDGMRHYSETAIHAACGHGTVDGVKLLLDRGANANLTNFLTPLHLASDLGRIEIVRELIGKGALVDGKDELGKTPLDYAVKSKEVLTCQILIQEHRASLNEVRHGSTPLEEACAGGSLALVKTLLEGKADPNFHGGETPLSKAVMSPSILRLLLQNGANPNLQNGSRSWEGGNYALHNAVRFCNAESVQILLDAHADPKLKNLEGLTPLDLAQNILKKAPHHETIGKIISLLKRAH